jgi:hypothetical protein
LEVPFTAVIMWALADGLRVAELLDVVLERTRVWFDVQISPETARSLLERLLEFGVLVQGTTAPIVE